MPPNVRKGLGKGLDALLGDKKPIEKSPEKVQRGADISDKSSEGHKASVLMLPLENIEAHTQQPRKTFDLAALEDLAESIKNHGIIQPIVVEEISDGKYRIVAGERRSRAARMAGLKEVPVVLKSFSDQARLEVALIENVQREDLNPIEEALAYKSLMEIGNLSQEEVAQRVGKKRSTVANALRLLRLPEKMHGALIDGRLSSGHARAILSLLNPADQDLLFERICVDNISVRQAETFARELSEGKRSAGRSSKKNKVDSALLSKDVHLEAIRAQIMEKLGTKVSIRGDLSGGTVHIDYYSMEDLDRLFALIIGD